MTKRGLFVAALIGGLVAVAVVLTLVLVAQRSLVGAPLLSRAKQGTLVGLALADASGDVAVRLVVYYPPDGGPGKVVDPSSRVAVPGTSSNTLGDAYAFGGGAALAGAYARLSAVDTPAWIVIEPADWARIGRPVSVYLPRPVDVFNGSELVSFPAGPVAATPAELGILLGGLQGLSGTERMAVLGQVAATLQRALAESAGSVKLGSDLSAGDLKAWSTSLAARSRPETSGP